MKWELLLAGPARKALKRIPAADQRQPVAWRRRVGDWRILFDIEPEKRRVLVHDVVRRTSTTY
jgi:mRNA-degrading endonuclease RelE of RelBE toxin-antitoxin system